MFTAELSLIEISLLKLMSDMKTLVYPTYFDFRRERTRFSDLVNRKDWTIFHPFAVLFIDFHRPSLYVTLSNLFLVVSPVCRCPSISCSRETTREFWAYRCIIQHGCLGEKNNIVVSSGSRLTSALSDGSSLGKKSANWIILERSCFGKKSGLGGWPPICFREVA